MIRALALILTLTLSPISFGASKADNLKLAKKLFRAGKKQQALKVLGKNLSSPPVHQGSLEYLAEVYSKMGRHAKAIKAYKILVKNFYDRSLVDVKNRTKLENIIASKLQLGKPPSKRVLQYFKKIALEFEAVARKTGLPKSNKKVKSLAIVASRYNFIYSKFRGGNNFKSDKRSKLESKAQQAYKRGSLVEAVKTYKILIATYYDKSILSIQRLKPLKSYLRNKVRGVQRLDNRTLGYFKQMARIYNRLAKKNKNRIKKRQLSRILWLRNKYIFIYRGLKDPSKYLFEKQDQLEPEVEASDDLPDENLPEEGDDLPAEEASVESSDYTNNTYLSLSLGLKIWQETFALLESTLGTSDGLNVIISGPCIGGDVHTTVGMFEYHAGGCLFLGSANIGSAPDAASDYLQTDVPVTGVFGGGGVMYRPTDKMLIGVDLEFFSRAADWAVPEETGRSYSLEDDPESLSGLAYGINARYEAKKWAIFTKIMKSNVTDTQWYIGASWLFDPDGSKL